jgi:hypothetical protein
VCGNLGEERLEMAEMRSTFVENNVPNYRWHRVSSDILEAAASVAGDDPTTATRVQYMSPRSGHCTQRGRPISGCQLGPGGAFV